MGNQPSTVSSSSQVDVDRLRPFFRGSLGLSRNELDKRCIPSGLYADCDWDKNAIRRLIADGRIAARQKGLDSPDNSAGMTEECPICFLNYSQVNTTNCCHASMCTECYLQVRPQKEKEPTCPFCNSTEFCVFVDKKKTPSEVCSETETSLSDSSGSSTTSTITGSKKKSTASIAPHVPTPPPSPKIERGGFGSQLEKDERFQRMRKRSESFASQNSDGPSTPKRDQDIIQSIAMSSEERQRLEEEMKAQHHHPLVLRLENEAEERRMENDRAYQNSARSQSATRNSHLARRMRAARNWDQFANFFDQREELNDMSALESAILYTRLAEASGQTTSGTNSDDSNDSNNNNQDQLDGFPLLRTLLTGQVDNNQGSSSSSSRSLRSSRRQRHPFMRSGLGLRSRGMSDVAMATASLMMRGISEEEQMAMAIAASMRDQDQPSENDENDDDDADTEEIGQAEETNSDTSNDDAAEENDQDENETSEAAEAPAQVPSAPVESKHLVSGDEESTITELARVVTDNGTADADTIPTGISA